MTEQQLHEMLKGGDAHISPVNAANSEKVHTDEYDRKTRPAKPGVRLKSSEHKEQVKLFKWAKENEVYYPHLCALYAIPNGSAKSSRIEAARMKKEGLRNGVIDVHLPCPIGEYSGLWIEMKYMYNKMSDDQREWADLMRWLGHRVETCYSFEEARWVLLDYLTESGTNLRQAA